MFSTVFKYFNLNNKIFKIWTLESGHTDSRVIEYTLIMKHTHKISFLLAITVEWLTSRHKKGF